MTIEIILAKSKNNCIGLENSLPWRLRDDLAYFKKVTDGKHVVMGRKTFESLPGKLPNRFITVLTTDQRFKHPDAHLVYHDANALAIVADLFRGDNFHAVISGGATIYNAVFGNPTWMEKISVIHVTEIDADVEVVSEYPVSDRNNKPFRILRYTRSV